jgi:hypothetical protein
MTQFAQWQRILDEIGFVLQIISCNFHPTSPPTESGFGIRAILHANISKVDGLPASARWVWTKPGREKRKLQRKKARYVCAKFNARGTCVFWLTISNALEKLRIDSAGVEK